MLTPRELDRLLDAAEAAARAAGRYLAARPEAPRVKRLARRDIKLAADTGAERRLLRELARRAPLPVLAEESGASAGDQRGPRWIVDPLDGTYNYYRGVPLTCVSVALWDGDRPVLGVIHDFERGELFRGAVGRGARLGRRPLRVSAVARPAEAVLATGLPAAADYSPAALARFARDAGRFRKLRLLGSAALSLAYVAAGRVDAYWEEGIRTWDIAAGAALVLAAGGRVDMRPTQKLNCWKVYAHNGRLARA